MSPGGSNEKKLKKRTVKQAGRGGSIGRPILQTGPREKADRSAVPSPGNNLRTYEINKGVTEGQGQKKVPRVNGRRRGKRPGALTLAGVSKHPN